MIIVIASFTMRLVWVMFVKVTPQSDFKAYHELAIGIVNNLAYQCAENPTAFRPIGYPLLLSLVYWIAGASPGVAQIVNVFLGTLTAVAVYQIATFIVSERLSLLAGLLVAFMPSLVMYSSLLASENLSTCLVTLSILCIMIALRRQNTRWLVTAGLCMGIAALARPFYLLFPIAFAIFFLFQNISLHGKVKCIAVFSLAFAAVIVPWSVRNKLRLNHLVPVSTNSGFNLAISFNETARGYYQRSITETTLDKTYDWDSCRLDGSPMDEIEIDAALRRHAVEYIVANPESVVTLAPAKLFYSLRGDSSALYYNLAGMEMNVSKSVVQIMYHITQTYYRLCLILAVVGAIGVIKYRRYRDATVLLLFIGYWIVLQALFFGDERFHVPILPTAIVLSCIGLDVVWSIGYTKRLRRRIKTRNQWFR